MTQTQINPTKAKKYEFKEDNFSIKLDNKWEKSESTNSMFGHSFFSAELKRTLVIFKIPMLFLQEDSRLPTNKQEFSQFVIDNYDKTQVKMISKLMQNYFTIESIEIANEKSFLVNLKSENDTTKIVIGFTLITHMESGYLFSIINHGDTVVTSKIVKDLTFDFKILNPEMSYKNIELEIVPKTSVYQSHYYGYQIPDFEGMIKATNVDVNINVSINDDAYFFNHLLVSVKSGYAFAITSVFPSEKKLSEKQLLSYFFQNRKNVTEEFTVKQDNNGGYYASGELLDKELKTLKYYFKVVSFYECQHIVIYYDTADRSIKPLEKFFSYLKETAINHALLSAQEIKQHKIQQAEMLNEIGNGAFYKDTAVSSKYFKQAYELDSETPVYLNNYLIAQNKQQQHLEALTFLNTVDNKRANEIDFLAWKAWLLYQTQSTTEAMAVYEKLFNNDYTNDGDFFSYLELLKSKDLWEKTLKAIKQNKVNVSKQKSLNLIEAMAYVKTKNLTKAKEIMATASNEDNIQDYNIYDILDIYFELEAYRKGIKLIQSQINSQLENANTYYVLGEFQFAANQPELAREAMQKALEYQPDDQHVQNYIDRINRSMCMDDIEDEQTRH